MARRRETVRVEADPTAATRKARVGVLHSRIHGASGKARRRKERGDARRQLRLGGEG